MSIFDSLLLIWICLLTLMQASILYVYINTLRSGVGFSSDPVSDPPMLVVLCLRGADPFLRECVNSLIDCNYSDLTVRIVVDSETDPAMHTVSSILKDRDDDRVELMILPQRLSHCSGKVSSLLYATETMPVGCEIVAWIDGDSMLHKSALSELAAGLKKKNIGAVSGNRWYVPPNAQLSGLTRMCWNAFAVPTMNMFGILWGGCMATHADFFRDPKFRSLLAHSFIEDSTISSYVRSHHMQTEMVGAAMLLNRESISFANQYRFAARQLFTVRIDNSRWPWLSAYMLALNSTLLCGLILLAVPATSSSAWIAAAYLLLLTVTIAAVPVGHLNVRRILTARGAQFPKLTWTQLAMMPAAIMVPNQLNLASTIHCFFIHTLTWRGITYKFGQHPKCTVVDTQFLTDQSESPLAQSIV